MTHLPAMLIRALLLLGASTVGHGSTMDVDAAPIKARIPATAHQSDGTIDLKLVPDFVVALGRDGKPVGYVSKHHILGDKSVRNVRTLSKTNIPVLDESLSRIVGHMVPGRGQEHGLKFHPLRREGGIAPLPSMAGARLRQLTLSKFAPANLSHPRTSRVLKFHPR